MLYCFSMKSYLFGVIVLLGIFVYGTSGVQAASTTTATSTAATAITASSSSKATLATTTAVSRIESEKIVRAYFADIPAMIEIARCESNFRQFTDAGNVFRDASGDMVGVFQFYEISHTAAAETLGFDLTTLDGNMKYARHLYEVQGTNPWRSCAPSPVVPVPNTEALTKLKIELMTKLISLLQQLIVLKTK
jgi:hypothetical protein